MYPENYTIALSNVTIINFIKKKTKSPKKNWKKKKDKNKNAKTKKK